MKVLSFGLSLVITKLGIRHTTKKKERKKAISKRHLAGQGVGVEKKSGAGLFSWGFLDFF